MHSSAILFLVAAVASASAFPSIWGNPGPVREAPDVAAARASHLQAVAEAAARNINALAAIGIHVAAPAPAPVILPAPAVDNADVASARAAHNAAHAAATSQALSALQAAIARGSIPVEINSRPQAPVSWTGGLPVAPVDNPDVAAAKAAHAQAHAEARARNLVGPVGPGIWGGLGGKILG